MKKQLMIALLSIAPALGVVAQDKLYKDEFPLGDITLLDGPLKHARDLNVQVLLKYDCDRMLAPYRKEAGLQQGVWLEQKRPIGAEKTFQVCYNSY